jgi:hypothetical protein
LAIIGIGHDFYTAEVCRTTDLPGMVTEHNGNAFDARLAQHCNDGLKETAAPKREQGLVAAHSRAFASGKDQGGDAWIGVQ